MTNVDAFCEGQCCMMGQEVDPIVRTLWRIIHFLDSEERHWLKQSPAWESRKEIPPGGDPRHDDDVTHAKHDVTRESRPRGRSHERRGRGVNSHGGNNNNSNNTPTTPTNDDNNDMTSAIPRSISLSPGRGRTPSPKRNPAPAPPNPLRCPSPAPKAVSTGDVLPSDQQGWLTDQLRGRRLWCAVADMLFCVFEKPDSKVSKQVLLLPGCKIRQVEFKTASRDNHLINGVGRKFRSKTVSGVDKFQFWIENGTKRQRFMFGVDSREELDRWINVLTGVASVDPDKIVPGDDEDGEGEGRLGGGKSDDLRRGQGQAWVKGEGDSDADGGSTPRSRSSSDASSSYTARSRLSSGDSGGGGSVIGDSGVDDNISRGSCYTPTQNRPRRIDFLSMSLSNARDVSRDSVEDIRKRLRREHDPSQETKATPLKAKYSEPDPTATTDAAVKSSSRRRRSFFRVGGFESLFSRSKKRSASADDAARRKALGDGGDSPRKSSETASGKENRKLSRTGSEELGPETVTEGKLEKRAFLSRSWDADHNSRGLGSSIRRSASDLKSKLFSTTSKSRGPGLRQADLTDFRLRGNLHYKGVVRWVRIRAVLCRGCFYGFRSERGDESPLLVFVLPQSTVSYVSADTTDAPTNNVSTTSSGSGGRRAKRQQFTFKLSQPHCRSLSLSADNHRELMAWLQALQLEACKLVADDEEEAGSGSGATADGHAPAVSSSSTTGVRRTLSSPSVIASGSDASAAEGSASESVSGRSRIPQMRPRTASLSSSRSLDSDGRGQVCADPAAGSPRDVLTSDATYDVRDDSPRHSVTPRSVKSSPRNSSGLTLAEELRRRHGLGLGPAEGWQAGGGCSDGDNGSSCGSSSSQPATPRHDDALAQVWGKDKGYLLQLIRTKLLRRKKKGGREESSTIYNKELLERPRDGGLLIQHDDDPSELSPASPREDAILGEVRHRSRSFTETRAHWTSQPQGGDNDDDPLSHHPHGWRSTPATPRDSHRGDVRHSSRHGDDVTVFDDAWANPSSRGAVTAGGRPRQRCVSADDADSAARRGVTSEDGGHADATPRSDDVEVVDSDIEEESDHDDSNDVDDVCGVDKVQRVPVVVEHSRTYSAAWDEYDSEEDSNNNNNNNNNNVSGNGRSVNSKHAHGKATSSDSGWISTTTESSAWGNSKRSENHLASDSHLSHRAHTIPRERPTNGVYPSQSQTAAPAASQNEEQQQEGQEEIFVSCPPEHDEAALRYSSSETLGRNPRGPILRYFQRARESGAGPAPQVSPRASSVESPRDKRLTFPPSPRQSAAEPQRSFSKPAVEAHHSSRANSAGQAHSPRKSSNGPPPPPPRPSNLPTPTAASPRKSLDKPSPRARSASQGPPVSPRRPVSAIPTSSGRSSLQSPPPPPAPASTTASSHPSTASSSSPRKLSSGIPVTSPRSSSSASSQPQRSSRADGSSSAPVVPFPRSSSAGPVRSSRQASASTDGRRDGSAKCVPDRGRTKGKGKGGSGEEGRVQPMAVMELAARDLTCPAMHGYLYRRTFSDQWVRYWYVLQDGCLYCYLTPDDDVTVDVTDLDGYVVTPLEDQFPGQRFVLHLEHEDYIPVYLSASSREDLEEWGAALTSALKVMPGMNGHNGHDLQHHGDEEGARTGALNEERVLGIKQKLLAEVLRQKQELEKKQAARLASRQKQLSVDDGDVILPPPPTSAPNPTGEQICMLTRLRQRRMSTQIKMDTLQRQMQSNGHSKKSRFSFGKRKSAVEESLSSNDPGIVEQLKTLSDSLSAIDRDLVQNGGVMTLDRNWSRGNRKMTSSTGSYHRHFLDSESSSIESASGGGGGSGGSKSFRSGGVESLLNNDDGGVLRSNSLKSSMQKLAHRTLAKAVWHRAKKSSSSSSISQGESMDKDDGDDTAFNTNVNTHPGFNSNHHQTHNHQGQHAPDVIDLSHRLARTWPARAPSVDSEEGGGGGGGGGGGEAFLPPPSSFTTGSTPTSPPADSPSPVSSPRSARSVSSVSSDRSQRHSSSGSAAAPPHASSSSRCHDDPRSPRRQVDPGAMANIEAFEEMTRQILGEAPT